jgi:hypothetical protein
MSPRFLQACEAFQPAEKACWEILLREHPDAAELSEPALNAAMNRTLAQLWSLLRIGSLNQRLAAAQSCSAPLPLAEPCALATHLPFFSAGERALDLIAQELERTHPEFLARRRASEREELRSVFHLLVHCQVHALCGRCAHTGECRFSGRTQAGSAGATQNVAGRRTRRRRSNRGGAARPFQEAG